MVQLQTINKIISTGDFSIVTKNALTRDYFPPYGIQFDFILSHYNTYGNVPDVETFMEKFPDFNLINVSESDEFLLEHLHEEYIYSMAVPMIQRGADLLAKDSKQAVQFLLANLPALDKKIGVGSVDILHDHTRYQQYLDKCMGVQSQFYIKSGFDELDYAINGWSREEEFIVMFARTNQSKSWVMTKTLAHASMSGYNVGLISPEMSPTKIGYRFDTLVGHFDNTALNWGRDQSGYSEHLRMISEQENHFYVATPRDFGGEITVSKIKTFIKNNNIQIIGIDGMSYLTDERRSKTDTRQMELTHISEDLFLLSSELHVPVIGVVQANRDGVKINKGELELENIRDADGISFNASKVIAIRQKADEEILELTVKKNRDGAVGGKFIYQWIPNTGTLSYIPSEDDGNEVDREQRIRELREDFAGEELPF